MSDLTVASPVIEVSAEPHPSVRRRVVAVVIGGVALQALLAVLFGWPAARSAPHDLPIAVAGPPTIVGPLVEGLAREHPGAFAIERFDDPAAARAAVTDRSAYGAIVVDPGGVTVWTAPPASPAVAQLLAEAVPAAVRAGRPGVPVIVRTLVPNPSGDPHGAVPAIVLIPIGITSLAAGALLAFVVGSAMGRLVGLLTVAVVAGCGTTAVVQSWIGGLAGSYPKTAGVLGLLILAIAATSAGLAGLLRGPGVGLAALTVFFFGFPFSGATNARELLPTPWGDIGAALPIGAGNAALRSVSFFDAAGAGRPLLVLGAWATGGLCVLLLAARIRPGPTRLPG